MIAVYRAGGQAGRQIQLSRKRREKGEEYVIEALPVKLLPTVCSEEGRPCPQEGCEVRSSCNLIASSSSEKERK